MTEPTQTTDLDSVLHFLQQAVQQNLASVDLAVAVAYIEQWENHLQGTELFQDLMQLKQALLDGHQVETQDGLRKVSEGTASAAKQLGEEGSREVATKLEQLSQLLSQAGSSAP